MGNSEEDKIDFKSFTKRSMKIGENQWLYPTGELDKLEKGVVEESETAERIVIDLYSEISHLQSKANFNNKKSL